MSNHNLNSLPVSTSDTQIEQIEPGFSSLAGKMLSGKTGQYAIHELVQNRPGVRTYTGQDLDTHAPVLIKEYHSFWWTVSDIQQIELDLDQLEAIDFRSGGVQDFRLLIPQESIASWKDHRCYLVLKCPQHQPRSLRSYLETQGCLPPGVVHHLLSQVLQSLWFLHSLAIYLEDKDEVKKGIAHGNLSLDSLLITLDPSLPVQPSQFQVYLQDLQLWEAAIQHTKPAQIQSAFKIQKQKDLQDLGKIAAQLLLGKLDLPEAWNPDADPQSQDIPDAPLKSFIQQLIGSEASTFSTAKAARTTLLSIPTEVESPPAPEQPTEPTEEQSNLEALEEHDVAPVYFKIAYAIVFSALILNIGLLWMSGKFSQPPSFNNTETTK